MFYLACSANLPKELYILPPVISSFFLLLLGASIEDQSSSFGGEHSNRVHGVVQRMSSNISGYTRPIFAIISPSESALHANDGFVPHSPICQGRCHGNQIISL